MPMPNQQPASFAATDIRLRFAELTEAWRRETAFVSSTTDLAMHPAYQHIIGLGPAALPLILSELERSGGHWFWALRAITGADPVPEEHRGRVLDMAADWLRWGKDHSLRW
jgi:hypothetical protein